MATEATTSEEVKTGTVVRQERSNGDAAAVRSTSALDEFLLHDKQEYQDPDVDPMERIIRQVLAAESPAAVLTPTEVKQARDMVGVPMLLADFDLQESEYDAGSPFYANMAVMLPGGEPTVVTCGHKKVLAQLVKLRQFDEFPYRVVFITRGTSKQGTPMLELTSWKDDDFESPPEF